jgi:phosphoglycerate dehydrogenase-like enzyme
VGDHEVILVLGVPEEKTRAMFRAHAPDGCEVVFSNGPEDLDGLLPEAHYIALWTAPLGGRELRAAKQLKYVQKVGEGTDRIDVETAKSLGLMVAKTVRENSYSTAEITILLMLAVLRRLPEAHNSLVNGEWLKWPIREHTFELRAAQQSRRHRGSRQDRDHRGRTGECLRRPCAVSQARSALDG